ncbi:hypothetical protein NIES4106_10990 [Fischerella sp. NIES-4106]|nr:hypothetical protein NIES4106_10990 [Fischerella sp. NIES-4106]
MVAFGDSVVLTSQNTKLFRESTALAKKFIKKFVPTLATLSSLESEKASTAKPLLDLTISFQVWSGIFNVLVTNYFCLQNPIFLLDCEQLQILNLVESVLKLILQVFVRCTVPDDNHFVVQLSTH